MRVNRDEMPISRPQFTDNAQRFVTTEMYREFWWKSLNEREKLQDQEVQNRTITVRKFKRVGQACLGMETSGGML